MDEVIRRDNRWRSRSRGRRGNRSRINNVNMGRDVLDELVAENEINHMELEANINDFIPNEQGDHLLYNRESANPVSNCTSLLIASVKIISFTVVFVATICIIDILVSRVINEYVVSNKQDERKMYYNNLKYKTDRTRVITLKIRQLNRKLRDLQGALDDSVKLSKAMQLKMYEINESNFLENKKISETINKNIEDALALYDADKTGMIDYALESAGGYITSILETTPYPSLFSYDIIGIVNIKYPSNPRCIIQPGIFPGECFAFKGTNGKIRIKLIEKILIKYVAIEHAHFKVVQDMGSAPKDFKVYGLDEANGEIKYELGAFTYDINKLPLQTFHIVANTDNANRDYEHIELEILTNYGNANYTCIYRFRVHGEKYF